MHDKQETSLNVRDGGDSQNLRGQDILRSSNCTKKNKKKTSLLLIGGGGCHLVSTHTLLPEFINREYLIIIFNEMPFVFQFVYRTLSL